eukprot:1404713-Pleurochrysis_carterae.AAC.1
MARASSARARGARFGHAVGAARMLRRRTPRGTAPTSLGERRRRGGAADSDRAAGAPTSEAGV